MTNKPKDTKKAPAESKGAEPTPATATVVEVAAPPTKTLDTTRRRTDALVLDGLLGERFPDVLAESRKVARGAIGDSADMRVSSLEAARDLLNKAEALLDEAIPFASRLDDFSAKDAPGQAKLDLDAAKAPTTIQTPRVSQQAEFDGYLASLREIAFEIVRNAPLDVARLAPETLPDFPVSVPAAEHETWERAASDTWDTAVASAQLEVALRAKEGCPARVAALSEIKMFAAEMKRTQPKDWESVSPVWAEIEIERRVEILSVLGVTPKGDIVHLKEEATS
jgi:hypothetical protein